jgi:archaellum component FlaC
MDSETADAFEKLSREVREGLQDVRTELRAEIQDVKRHSDVIAESLRGEIRLVAEGVAGLDEKFTREFRNVREEVREQIGEVKTLLRLSYQDLDRRIGPS